MTQRERIIEAEVAGWPEPLRMVYEGMRQAGESVVLAHMLASQSAPTMGMQSDRQFNSSYRRYMNRMSEVNRNAIVKRARAAGISTDGKYYVSGLGRYDDPAAWCSTADDVKTAAMAKNCSAQGPGVNVTCKPKDPPQKNGKALAPDIAKRLEKQYLKKDPALAEKCGKNTKARAELRDRVVQTHGR